MKKIKTTVIMLMAVFAALAFTGCDKAPYSETGECMNTSYEITIYDEDLTVNLLHFLQTQT